MHLLPKLPKIFGLVLTTLFLFSCGKEIVVPSKDEFTKADRERLGQMIETELLADNIFEILPHTPPYDSSIYWYIQTLYDQATNAMRLDKKSPSNNRWNQERQWKVSIIDDDSQKMAFILPGGNLYISTSLLKSLDRAYELYYFLAFESALMNETILLTRLIEEYNAITLRNLLDGKAPANDVTIDIIVEDFPDLNFEATTVQDIDQLAVNIICETSIFDRTGIAPFLLDDANQNAHWVTTRTTYEGRIEQLLQFELEEGLSCGNVIGDGAYQTYVLSVLD